MMLTIVPLFQTRTHHHAACSSYGDGGGSPRDVAELDSRLRLRVRPARPQRQLTFTDISGFVFWE